MADVANEIATAGKIALAALQATAQVYNATQQPMPPHVMSTVDVAGQRAHASLASLRNADPAHVATLVGTALQEVATIAAALPPGVIPPVAQAAILAFSALSGAAGPLIADAIKAHRAAAAPDAAAAPVSPAAPPEAVPQTLPTAPVDHPHPEAPAAGRFEPLHPPVHAGAPRH